MTKKTNELLRASELAEVTGVRFSTIKYYSESGLLPYQQEGKRLNKRYPKDESYRRIQAIKKLKEKGMLIPEIIKHFKGSTGGSRPESRKL